MIKTMWPDSGRFSQTLTSIFTRNPKHPERGPGMIPVVDRPIKVPLRAVERHGPKVHDDESRNVPARCLMATPSTRPSCAGGLILLIRLDFGMPGR